MERSRSLKLASFDEVAREIDALERAGSPRVSGAWSLPKVLEHCAQSIEYSVTGYPVLRSAPFRATIGPLVKWRFLSRGEMSHGLDAVIEGAPPLTGTDPRIQEVRLRQAIAVFRSHHGALAPHLAYGPCTKAEYEELHAMHVADHLRDHW